MQSIPASEPDIEIREECLVSGALHIVLRMSVPVGLAPLRFKKQSNGWRIRISSVRWFAACAFFFIITLVPGILCVIHEIRMANHFNKNDYMSQTHRVLFLSHTLSNLTTQCFVGFTTKRRIKSIILCLSRIEKIKTSLHVPTIWNNRKVKILATLYALYIMIVSGIDFFGALIPDLDDSMNHFFLEYFDYIEIYLVFIASLQFMLVVLEISSALQSINDVLLRFLDDEQETAASTFGICDSMSTEDIFRNMYAMYMTVCEVIQELNKNTGIMIMAILFKASMILIATYYALTAIVAEQLYETQRIMVTSTAAWSLAYVFFILSIVEPCHSTHCKMANTGELVSKLALKYSDDATSIELRKFRQYILLVKPYFAPMKICILNRTLLVTIVSMVTTYIVITIQFQGLS